MINKTAAAYIFPYLWAFCSPYTKNRTKQKPEQMRTFCPIASAFPSVTTAAADPHTKRKPPTAFYFFTAFNRKRAAVLKPSLFQKTLHQIAQYSTQYFMQSFAVYFSIYSCISGYYVVYFNQDKERHNNSEA